MPRIPIVDPATTTGRTRLLLDSLKKSRGRVTNMVGALANSPSAVSAFFSFNAAMASSAIPVELRERIALAVAEENGCQTCLAAHTEFGRVEGISVDELAAARNATSDNPQFALALRFAVAVLKTNGRLSDDMIAEAHLAGLDDAYLLDIVATVYINAFTNAINHFADTEPDHWQADPVSAA